MNEYDLNYTIEGLATGMDIEIGDRMSNNRIVRKNTQKIIQ